MSKLLAGLMALCVVLILLAGWMHRDDDLVTPERGLGYWLGIGGGASMLLLLLYPLRKRLRRTRALGSVSGWFRLHMLLGVAGPILILYHCNFKLGSLNSNIALGSMLLVAGSGIVGRYLYRKIHIGLYGRKAAVQDFLDEMNLAAGALGKTVKLDESSLQKLHAVGARTLHPARGLLRSSVSLVALSWEIEACRRSVLAEVRRDLATQALHHGWSWRLRRRKFALASRELARFCSGVRRAAAFSLFERLFALWHVLHLPLFIILVMAAVLHVIAVHTY